MLILNRRFIELLLMLGGRILLALFFIKLSLNSSLNLELV